MPFLSARASMDDVWLVLTDPRSWETWWPQGSPSLQGTGWVDGSELVWAPPREPARAVLKGVYEPAVTAGGRRAGFSIHFVEGTDGFHVDKGREIEWSFSIEGQPGSTEIRLSRSGARPPRWVGAVRAWERAQRAIEDGLRTAVGNVTASAGPVPDIEAMARARDVDGLLAALRHEQPWVRAGSAEALRFAPGVPRVIEGLVAAASDPDVMVRLATAEPLGRTDDEDARSALLRLIDDEDAQVRNAALTASRSLRAAMEAAATRGYGAEERRQLAGTEGPRFDPKTTEVFLAPDLAIHVMELSAFEYRYAEARNADAPTTPVRVLLLFPRVCSACLEPTERSLFDVPRELSWFDSTATTTRERKVTVHLAVPMCERCMGYGMESLLDITSSTASGTDWRFDHVRFRFPNIGYYAPFCDANRLGRAAIAKPKDSLIGGFRNPTMSAKDERALDEAERAWVAVRDGIGFHRYACLKHRLLQENGPDLAALAAIAAEGSVSLEQLREVEDIAQRPIPALRTLGV